MESGSTLTFRRAGRADEETLRRIYDEIGAWLHDVKGITTQWDRAAPDELIRFLIDSGEVYLVLQREEVAGAVRITEHAAVGLENWGDDALYVYSLAVRRMFAGLGLGEKILEWIAEHARGRGKTCLRLDCMSDNARLIRYYVDAGFEFLGRHPQETWYALFEKKIV